MPAAPQSAQQALRATLAAALRADPALSGVPVAATRRRPMPERAALALFVDLEVSTVEDDAPIGQTEWVTRYAVEAVARDAAGVAADTEADRLITAAYGRLLTPGVLSSSVTHVQPLSIAWAEDELDSTLAIARFVLELRHGTEPATLSAA